jgi:hypothetical protein
MPVVGAAATAVRELGTGWRYGEAENDPTTEGVEEVGPEMISLFIRKVVAY